MSDPSEPTLWDDFGNQAREPTWSVGEIGEAIGAALRQVFSREVWLRGEIRNISRGKTGTVWFDLVEPPPKADLGRPPVATLPIVLFNQSRMRVNARIVDAGGAVRMENGTEVRIQGRIGFWAPGGRLQLVMSDIDPAFTLGQLAADKERLLRQLRAQGLLDRQKQLGFPRVPLQLGLVTSAGSAAEHDVLNELHSSGIGFRVRRAPATVQGRHAPRSVAAALKAVARAGGVDVVLLVRGGGSATDLAAFDSEVIARAVAELDVPVITGIGHEIDRSVADEAAHSCYKTPTACAQAVIAAVREFDELLGAAWAEVVEAAGAVLQTHGTRLRSCARQVALGTRHGLAAANYVLESRASGVRKASTTALERNDRHLERATGRVQAGARVHLRTHDRRISQVELQLTQRAPRVLEAAGKQLANLEQQVRALDPVRTLARGWSISRTASGELVRHPNDVTPGDKIVTSLSSGKIRSTVNKTEPQQ